MAYKNGTKRKRKKSKGKKLFRRLFVLGFLGMIVWAAFLGVRWTARLTLSLINRPSYVSTATATEAQDQHGLQGEAVLLRKEIVVLADKPGIANLLLDAGTTAAIGERILEIVDKSLLASIEDDLRKLDKQANQPSVDHTDEVARLDERIAEKESKLQDLVNQYRTALAGRSLEQYKDIYADMSRYAQELSSLQQNRLQLIGTANAIQEQREALLARREQAIVAMQAPVQGRAYFLVDGLEQSALVSAIGPGTWDALKTDKGTAAVTRDGDQVAAGQPLFKLVTSDEVYLLVQLGKDNVNSTTGWQGVKVQSDALNDKVSFSAELVAHQGLGADQLLLKVTEPLPGLYTERIVSLRLFPQGEILCEIPASALLPDDASVFVLDGTIARKQAVTVRGQAGKNAVVAGLQPGTVVLKRPGGISDGEDIGPRLRK